MQNIYGKWVHFSRPGKHQSKGRLITAYLNPNSTRFIRTRLICLTCPFSHFHFLLCHSAIAIFVGGLIKFNPICFPRILEVFTRQFFMIYTRPRHTRCARSYAMQTWDCTVHIKSGNPWEQNTSFIGSWIYRQMYLFHRNHMDGIMHTEYL
jgi:hypothetical protein